MGGNKKTTVTKEQPVATEAATPFDAQDRDRERTPPGTRMKVPQQSDATADAEVPHRDSDIGRMTIESSDAEDEEEPVGGQEDFTEWRALSRTALDRNGSHAAIASGQPQHDQAGHRRNPQTSSRRRQNCAAALQGAECVASHWPSDPRHRRYAQLPVADLMKTTEAMAAAQANTTRASGSSSQQPVVAPPAGRTHLGVPVRHPEDFDSGPA